MKIAIGILTLVLSLSFSFKKNHFFLSDDQKLSEVLAILGEKDEIKKADMSIKGVSARVGEDIVKYGFSKRKGSKKSKRQSKHFVCTSCHNTVREDPVLASNDPQARLIYTYENGIPFLQATTLYGAVNRETYYNGDYEKIYGDLVKPARHNIREAIQLCATECAQGREMDLWELESILAYLWEIELIVSDLQLSEIERSSVESAMNNDVIKNEGLKFIKSKYLQASEATFVYPPENRKVGTGYPGDTENGRLIYENSCLHCHFQKKYSFLNLDKNKMSFKYLDRKAGTYSRHSIYQVIRFGTYSKYGKKSYMPRYTAEKMSDQQLADLRAYIEQQAHL